ncbi:MAG: acylneuraminate cytidylyltransferase family protein [Bacillaceae bacterium]|nr:acylneuraminate cytidylyltransferase family protein [Bacillaceae bacterium]
MKTLAIIPARGGSKGLKRKNLLPLNGIPLIEYTIKSALKCSEIHRVIVSTEDREIANVAIQSGAEVPFLRPHHLATDEATTIDVLVHVIQEMDKEDQFDNIVLLQPTSPLRNEKHISEALQLFQDKGRNPVVSVCEAFTHPNICKKISDGKLVNYVKYDKNLTRRQDFEAVYQLNGAIYITTRDMILYKNKLYDEIAYPYIMDKQFSVDIDDQLDFKLAEIILKEKWGDSKHV